MLRSHAMPPTPDSHHLSSPPCSPHPPFSPPSHSPAVSDVDETRALRLEIFAPYRDRIRSAHMMLTWTRSGEKVYPWPCHSNVILYADHELPEAYESFYLELPECPCVTQETNPEITHYYDIWVVQTGRYQGKVAAACAWKFQGCGSWSLPNFDRYGLLHTIVTATPSVKNIKDSDTPSQGQLTPPPPYQSTRARGHGFSGIAKSTRNSSIKSPARLHLASNEDPFIINSHSGSPSASTSSMFTVPSLPLPSHSSSQTGSIYGSSGPAVPESTFPASTTMPPSNQLARLSSRMSSVSSSSTGILEMSAPTTTTPRSYKNLHERVTIMPGDRMFGDTSCLWEPPEPRQIITYNRHVEALRGSDLEKVFQGLHSPEGVMSETFWKAFDLCNCGQWFTKENLHYVHGPDCPLWVYADMPTSTQAHRVP
ncbi:hypothetical protein JB92DRAFT_3147134 [Gautieria morchelliformis]|nr:hypothetical protein JB92DRAFT_3147134 [Gautieria morchelliformis]